MSAAKVSGALMALMGLIFGGMMTLISSIAAAFHAHQNGPQFPAVMGMAAIVFMPILYGAFGFVMGAIYAALYNLIAGMVGGLELEFEDSITYSSSPPS